MISIKILDYFGKELNENSLVKRINEESEETYGKISPISIEWDNERILIKAFKEKYACGLLYNYGNFKIVGEK